jgi:N-methylhydantoinase A
MPRTVGHQSELRIAIDTGGTFTDCVWVERGRVRMLKIFSTPNDPSRAILEAVQRVMQLARPRAARPTLILLHGTTVGTNTLLQRTGARVAFVTTKGFEDTIEIARQARPRLYDYFFDRIEPLVSPELRFGVDERVTADAEVLKPPANLSELTSRVEDARPEAIALSLLFSFANPKNEQQVADALKTLNLPLSISHRVLPEFREYERASTVVVNAYLQPVMERYLTNLAGSMKTECSRVKSARIFVMQSSGGITSLDLAAREPVRTVLSGPAGGVVGAAAVAKLSGFRKIIAFDMGGTSTDVCLVDREAQATNEAEVAGLPVRVPMLAIHTVGAGGGSIARFDAAGALRVGPESAGADPGPICYGRGDRPTVTDANLLLGNLCPDAFLGGEFTLDLPRTERIVRHWLKQHNSKLTVKQFAKGIIRVVNSTIEKAVRVVSIEKGYDPRDFSLVAFGGAGGLHACELAAALGISKVIVPAMPGALSAYGILVSDVVKDYSRTLLLKTRDSGVASRRSSRGWETALQREFQVLRQTARREFKAEGWKEGIRLARSADLRYRGQGFEINVPFTSRMIEHFHAEHNRRYGYSAPEREVEIVTVRLRACMKSKTAALPRPAEPNKSKMSRESCVLSRESLQPGSRYHGPAVITEYSATTLVPAKASFYIDRVGNLLIDLTGK